MLYFVRQILLQSTRRVFYITIIVFYRPYSRKGEKTIKVFRYFFLFVSREGNSFNVFFVVMIH